MTEVPVEEKIMKMSTRKQATCMAQWLWLAKAILKSAKEKKGLHLGLKHAREKEEKGGTCEGSLALEGAGARVFMQFREYVC